MLEYILSFISYSKHGIHPLTQSDYKDVCEIFKDSFDTEKIPLKNFLAIWEQREEETCGWFDSYGKLLGFAIIVNHSGKKYLEFLGVYESERNRGIGSCLLKYILALESIPSIYLWPISERLKTWYIRNGFYHTSSGYYAFHKYNTRSKKICQMCPFT
jgi:hypothetical protein